MGQCYSNLAADQESVHHDKRVAGTKTATRTAKAQERSRPLSKLLQFSVSLDQASEHTVCIRLDLSGTEMESALPVALSQQSAYVNKGCAHDDGRPAAATRKWEPNKQHYKDICFLGGSTRTLNSPEPDCKTQPSPPSSKRQRVIPPPPQEEQSFRLISRQQVSAKTESSTSRDIRVMPWSLAQGPPHPLGGGRCPERYKRDSNKVYLPSNPARCSSKAVTPLHHTTRSTNRSSSSREQVTVPAVVTIPLSSSSGGGVPSTVIMAS